MGDYNLAGLNEREFEHLTQSLALKTIAAGVIPYGDGKDGGREATFTGNMDYPSATDPWNGYLVIQCKFLKRPQNSTKDGNWALKQLNDDLKKFHDSKRNLKKPDYYLYVTNVILTPVQDTGSSDKVRARLQKEQDDGKIKGFDIWDHDKICRLIDANSEVASKYLGFITSGDVLAKMMEVLQDQTTDFDEVMSLFLQKEMRSDQFVRLEQAGQSADHKISLAHVFIDLYATSQPTSEPPIEVQDLTSGLLEQLIGIGKNLLRPSIQAERAEKDSTKKGRSQSGRFVVLGGPGQGKSTLGQCLCQAHRAAILKGRPRHRLGEEAASALEIFTAQCEANDVLLPTARRFPVRIVLDRFAAALAKDKEVSLLSYIVQHINAQTDHACKMEDLRRWLRSYPWLLVLDGLDEVPASSNRQQVLEKITAFWELCASLDADILVVATTRPQGYSDEFSPKFYHHLHLSPLSVNRALLYARRLVESRYSGDSERRQKIMGRLETACKQETTARLMQTPLQVTIMATLVERSQPPQERWRLFKEYYDVIYLRETERDIPASRILQSYKADVDAIHARVGLLLQAQSEKQGSTAAQLSSARFESLVRARISEEGYEGESLQGRVREITEAALNRLVFLVGLEADGIGFELRSLQEFMAAEALTDGTDSEVRIRLEKIAPIEYWNNVFLFAAGKCFAERQAWRDMIVNLCAQLNDPQEDPLAATTRAGSQLALDVYNDGVEGEQLKFRRQLAGIALDLLDVPDSHFALRLADSYEPEMEAVFQECIRQRLERKYLPTRIGAWSALKQLISGQTNWAEALADEHWPHELGEQIQILGFDDYWIVNNWTAPKIIQVIPHVALSRIGEMPSFTPNLQKDLNLPAWCDAVSSLDNGNPDESKSVSLQLTESSTVHLSFTTVVGMDETIVALKEMALKENSWAPYIAAARFIESPKAHVLGRELKWLSENWEPLLTLGFGRIPWPLLSCLRAAKNQQDLVDLAHRAETGQLGDFDDWVAAEKRWESEGLAPEDLKTMDAERWPFDERVREIGFPFNAATWILTGQSINTQFSDWWQLREMSSCVQAREEISRLLEGFLLSMGRLPSGVGVVDSSDINPVELKEMLFSLPKFSFDYAILDRIIPPGEISTEWMDFLDALGRRKQGANYVGQSAWPRADQVAAAFQDDPTRVGLLSTSSTLVIEGSVIPLSNELLNSYLQCSDQDEAEELAMSALFVRLSHGNWDDAEVSDLSRVAAFYIERQAARNYTSTIEWILTVMLRHAVSESDQERFLLALWNQMASQHSMQTSDLISHLNRLRKVRQSQLDEPEVWKQLALPDVGTD